ncbi:MAG: tetratricopeptide repeat protein [Nitrospirae bacterium YQR-1]
MMMKNTKIKGLPGNYGFTPVDIAVAVITLTTIFVYYPVGRFDFVLYDDQKFVTENINLRYGFTLSNVLWAFHTVSMDNWQPLTVLSHMFDVTVFGLNPGWHHLMSLLLHIIASCALFFTFHLATQNVVRSTAVALVFAIHPMHIESVAWIAERKDVMCALFWFLTLYSYTKYVKNPAIMTYTFFFICCLCTYLSKPMAVTLPVTLLLFDLWPLKRIDLAQKHTPGRFIRLLVEKIPVFILTALMSIVTLSNQKKIGAYISFDSIPLTKRVLNAVMSYWLYLKKFFFPADMACFYPFIPDTTLWQYAPAALSLFVVTAFMVVKAKKFPCFFSGWLWYLVTLLPVIGIIQVGLQSMADRYTYIPYVGLSVICVNVAADYFKKPLQKKILTAVSVTVIVVFIFISKTQLKYWENTVTLSKHATEVTHNNHIAYSLLGTGLLQRGKTNEAIENFKKSLEINPKYHEAWSNLAHAYDAAGDYKKAVECYQKAIDYNPLSLSAYTDMATVYLKQNEISQASELFAYALKTNNNDFIALNGMAVVLAKQGKYDEAADFFHKALKVNPFYAEAKENMAVLEKITSEKKH